MPRRHPETGAKLTPACFAVPLGNLDAAFASSHRWTTATELRRHERQCTSSQKPQTRRRSLPSRCAMSPSRAAPLLCSVSGSPTHLDTHTGHRCTGSVRCRTRSHHTADAPTPDARERVECEREGSELRGRGPHFGPVS